MVTACLCHVRDIAQDRLAVPSYTYLVVGIWFSILLKFDYFPFNFFHLRITYVLEVGSTSADDYIVSRELENFKAGCSEQYMLTFDTL